MLAPSQSPRLFKVVGGFLILLTFYYFSRSTREVTGEVVRQFKNQKNTFVSDFLENDLVVFDGSGLESLCASTDWDRGLVFQCEPPFGGAAGVRNAELHCIRLAIETRAARLILPGIIRRDDHDISKLQPNARGPQQGTPPEYFFDIDFLKESFARHCPQMTIYSSLGELHDMPSLLTSVDFNMWNVFSTPGDFVNHSVMARPENWDARFRVMLDQKSPKATRKSPIRVNMQSESNSFPIESDPHPLIRDFAGLLRPRPDVRRLAATALFALQQRFAVNLDPRHGINRHGFVGVHLRTENDAEQRGYPSYVDQAASSLDFILSTNATVVFLATGASDDDVDNFALRAADFNLTVVTKSDLLSGDDLAHLRRMTYDQRGMVDYEIMSRASRTTGPSASKFSFGLAVRRARAYGSAVVLGDDGVRWRDEFTTLYGTGADSRDVRFLTTWP